MSCQVISDSWWHDSRKFLHFLLPDVLFLSIQLSVKTLRLMFSAISLFVFISSSLRLFFLALSPSLSILCSAEMLKITAVYETL